MEKVLTRCLLQGFLKTEGGRKATDTHLGKGGVQLPLHLMRVCEANSMDQLKSSPPSV